MKEFVEVEMKSIYVIITNTQNMANLFSNVRPFEWVRCHRPTRHCWL
jgi:hypothetical protein